MSNRYSFGTNANYADIDDMRSLLTEIDFDNKKAISSGIPIVSDGHKALVWGGEQSTMIVASTGSGKTRRVVLPYTISSLLEGNSVIINDVKSEIYKSVSELARELGYNIIVINFRYPKTGHKYNLLKIIDQLYKAGERGRAAELAQSMATTMLSEVKSEKDPFWHITAGEYLAGLILLACEIFPSEQVTLDNIFLLHLQGDKRDVPSRSVITSFFDRHEDMNCWKKISASATAPNETRTALYSVFTSALSKYVQNEDIIDFGSDTEFDIRDIARKKTAIFIIGKDESSVYDSYTSALIAQIYTTLIDYCEAEYDGRFDRRIDFIIDEFGNLAPLPDIANWLTVSRSRNVRWCLACQSLMQLNLKYSPDVSKIIIGNCNNLVYMYSNDYELLKYISDLCGYDKENDQEEKKLLNPDELRQFSKEDGEMLLLMDRMKPFVAHLPDISKYTIISPIPSAKLPVREKSKIQPIDFVEYVRKDREKAREEESKLRPSTYKFPSGPRPGIPTYEEWLANRNKTDRLLEEVLAKADAYEKENEKQTAEDNKKDGKAEKPATSNNKKDGKAEKPATSNSKKDGNSGDKDIENDADFLKALEKMLDELEQELDSEQIEFTDADFDFGIDFDSRDDEEEEED